MLRLTVCGQTPEEALLQVDGWVMDAEVALLAQEGTRLLAESQRLVLDLKGVRFIEADGVALLVQWAGPRLVLLDGPVFLQRLLQWHGLPCDGAGG